MNKWENIGQNFVQGGDGQNFFIQNQQGAGKLSIRWDRTGLVIENNGHVKYTVKVDGSGRVVQRNRRYLRGFKSMELRQPGTRTPLPEIKIELDGGNTDTTQDHYETIVDRDEPRKRVRRYKWNRWTQSLISRKM